MGYASAATAAPAEELIAGRYRVERLLGQGGMGAVYAVVDVTSNKSLALKRLTATASAATAALFEREYHTLAGLRHPCIVEVYEYGADDDGVFYTMELIEGRDLSKGGPLPWRKMCRDLRDTASILGLLHARQLLHRDLSPRNLLRSSSGRLKLIDFGALAPFGPSREVVGTPPFVAPEALASAPLDQRADMFALGALAYWLVTGTHAFPARSLAELPTLWKQEVTAASEMLALIKSDVLEPIPRELDELIAGLLRIDPAERLGTTAELIDHLNTLAELEPESNELAVQGYLDSKAFVGRARERERVLTLLSEASAGGVRTLLVEGDAGVGRTRFLQELSVIVRLAGALPVVASGSVGTRPYGLAEALVFALLRTLPEVSRSALAEHAALLSSISKELRDELAVSHRQSSGYAPAELRVRLLSALRDVLLTVSRERALVLLVDDLQASDDESQALLTALAHAPEASKLLIVVALGRSAKREASAAVSNLRSHAARVRLLPLSKDETLELLRSVFGTTSYLDRLSERLYRASDGNPAYCLELAAHLVHSGAARYEDGLWSLPAELAPGSLPESREAAQLGRLERLSQEAHEFARKLSVPHSTELTLGQCVAISDLSPSRVEELLAELVREGVLRSSGAGHRFCHSEIQAALYAQLDAPSRAHAHLRLGEELVAQHSGAVLDELRAAAHFLRGDDLGRAYAQLRFVSRHYSAGDFSTLRAAAPLIEEVYQLLNEREQDKFGTLTVLSLLAISGYFADRRYANLYGDKAIAVLQEVLRLSLARRLTRFVGAKLALIVALVIAGVSLRLRKNRAPSLKQAVRYLTGGAAALAGTAACCVDPDKALRYATVIEPFTVLGADHAASFTYHFAKNLVPNLQERPADAYAQQHAFFQRIDAPVPIRDLPDGVRVNYAAGCLFSQGVVETWRDTPECLQTADRLEQFSPLYAMSADHLRASYYAGQGDMQRSDCFQKRLEVHAVTLGSAWQAETWAPLNTMKNALRVRDPSLMKRAMQEMNRLSSELPSFVPVHQQAHGFYLVMREKYEQAIPVLEVDAHPPFTSGWPNARGELARAYNRLGKHKKAREICLDAMALLKPEDLAYVTSNLSVQIELAIAEAGSGRCDAARASLDALLKEHEHANSPITMGQLHDARAQVALRERDFKTAHEHATKMENRYRSTGVATLIALAGSLKRAIDRVENPRANDAESDVRLDHLPHVLTRVQLMLDTQAENVLSDRARKGLQVALELSSADEGLLVLAGSEGEPAAHLGSAAPDPELVRWAEQNILDAAIDEQTVMTAEVDSETDSNYKVVGSMRYCVIPLWAHQQREDRIVAALVLGFDNRVPRMPEPAVVRAIAMHLVGSTEH